VASVVGGTATGLLFTAGFIGMYLCYEVLHRRAHTHPPRGSYGRWLRRNHFAHHFADPRRAHGVTTPLWDFVFATRLAVDRVRVPRRLAMPWLVDARSELLPAHAEDYELVGGTTHDARTRQSDIRAAMENRSPVTAPGAPEARA
jgi:hypothetical protein